MSNELCGNLINLDLNPDLILQKGFEVIRLRRSIVLRNDFLDFGRLTGMVEN